MRFEELLDEGDLENLVELEREMIDRFRELRAQSSYPSRGARVPVYPEEFYRLWYRLNTVQRKILERRKGPEEAQITPELNRMIDELRQELQELT